MAYDEYIVERIRRVFDEKQANYYDKSMMGGRLFMVNDKMACGVHIDKKFGDTLLMARIGEKAYEENIHRNDCLPMDFTGRAMCGYIYVTPVGIDSEENLTYWIQLVLDFNPHAKASKKRKKQIGK